MHADLLEMAHWQSSDGNELVIMRDGGLWERSPTEPNWRQIPRHGKNWRWSLESAEESALAWGYKRLVESPDEVQA